MTDQSERSTVLVVDDERGPRESLRMILSPDYQVLQASSAAEALDVLATETVDLATLDLNMPGMSGQDLMREIRSEHPRVEIIVITGCGSVESAAEGIRSGICDYLQKPFDVVQVSAAVSRAEGNALLDPPRTLEFLEVLAETIETKDRYMRGHARRVAFYSSLIADRLCLSPEEHSRVRIAGFLHDLGKVGVPTYLLLRKGAITQPEREIG